MGTATVVSKGDAVDYTPGSAATAGDVVVQEELVGVVIADIAANVLGSLTVEGIFDFTKATLSTSAIAAGKNVYWNTSTEVATETVGSNKLIGKAVAAAAAADTTVRVKLNQ